MFKLSAYYPEKLSKELGLFSSLQKCSVEIHEWLLNDSDIGTKITDCTIKAVDQRTGIVYIHAPPDLTEPPSTPFDPDHPYDWTIETPPVE